MWTRHLLYEGDGVGLSILQPGLRGNECGRVKRFIYNRTQRGGHGGAAGEVQSTAKALMNYIGRLWLYELDGGDGSDENGWLANLVKRYSSRYWTLEDEAEVEFETAVAEHPHFGRAKNCETLRIYVLLQIRPDFL
jgi:hypothetical protein